MKKKPFPSQRPPRDEDQRRRVREDLGRCLTIQAGAGTGKTRLLVDRIIALIEKRNARLDRMAVITFTEKAAGELRIRVRDALEARLVSAGSDPDGQEKWLGALEKLEWAQISTIHAFASRLLRDRPIEAGLDPGFTVADEAQALDLRDRSYREWLEEVMSRKPAVLHSALREGLTLSSLRKLADALNVKRDLIEYLPEARYISLDDLPGKLKAWSELMRDLCDQCSRPEKDVFVQRLQAWSSGLNSPPVGKILPFKSWITIGKTSRLGNQKNWDKEVLAQVRKEVDQIRLEMEKLDHLFFHNLTVGVADLLRDWLMRFDRAKRQSGFLDFDDLLVHARDLLRDHRDSRRFFQNQYDTILVDEFQDTDPLQAEIVFFLAEDGARADHWREVKLKPGKLLLVGDPKQAIYRFRRADLGVYARAYEAVAGQGTQIAIHENFRSLPALIEWLNPVFRTLFETSGQVAYQALTAYRSGPKAPAVKLLTPDDRTERTTEECCRLESRLIGGFIRQCLDDNSQEYCLSDFAVLFRSATNLTYYEQALEEQELAYHLQAGRLFFSRGEVRAIRALLAAIANPADELALVAALRSDLLGISDMDLFRLRTDCPASMSYLNPPKGLTGPCADALTLLAELHKASFHLTLASLVEEIYRRTAARELTALRPGGAAGLANLDQLKWLACRHEDSPTASLGSFIHLLEQWTSAGEHADSPSAEPTDEAVSLLTIHKAKGLEFNVVILADLDVARRGSKPPRLLSGPERNRLEILLTKEFKTAEADELAELDDIEGDNEEKRLLYVAATRAKRMLVLPDVPRLAYKKPVKNSFLQDFIKANWESGAAKVSESDLNIKTRPGRDRRLLRQLVQELEAPAQAVQFTRRRADLEQIRKDFSDDVEVIRPSEQVEKKPGRGGAGERGRLIGSAVHEVLALIDLKSPSEDEIQRLCRAAAERWDVPADVVEPLVARTLDCEVIRKLARAEKILQEVSICSTCEEEEKKFIEGQIDLLARLDGRWILADYKTDAIGKGNTLADLTESKEPLRGRPQLLTYVQAAQRALGEEIHEAWLIACAAGTASQIIEKN